MNVSNELLIEVALNVVGFVASGALLLVIYSMLNNRSKNGVSIADNVATPDIMHSTEAELVEPRGKVEFVNFGAGTVKTKEQIQAKSKEIDSSSRFQRNRLEVIKQAKEMLNAGNGSADIRRKLPIAEAELNMINQQRNSWNQRGAANDQ